MKSELTYQQDLVFKRLKESRQSIDSANEYLESRATKLLALSTASIAFVVGVNALPSKFGVLNGWELLVLVVLCISVMVMYGSASHAWAPWALALPGSSDVNILYQQYIAKDIDTAFNNAMIDEANAVELAIDANKKKAQAVKFMFCVLQAQILLLAVTITVKWATQAG